MTKPKTAKDIGAKCWKVRISIRGAGMIHVLSSTEPVVEIDSAGAILDVAMDSMVGTRDGDTVGYICWADVSALTWRQA